MIDIDRLVKDLGMRKIDLANMFKVSPANITKIAQGKMNMPKEWQAEIKRKFGVNTQDYVILSRPPARELPDIHEDPNGKAIPFYDLEVYATISPAMSDVVALKPAAFINIPMFSQGEYALQVTGHSMKGLINHGDWIVVKRITNRDAVIFGEPYLIVTKSDNLKTVKFLKASQDDPGNFCLVPYNIEQFEEQDIKKEEVLELYRVVGLFRST